MVRPERPTALSFRYARTVEQAESDANRIARNVPDDALMSLHNGDDDEIGEHLVVVVRIPIGEAFTSWDDEENEWE